MDKMFKYLGNHPIIGICTSFVSALISYLQQLSEILQFAGIVIGLIIGILTAIKLFLQCKKEVKLNRITETIDFDNDN